MNDYAIPPVNEAPTTSRRDLGWARLHKLSPHELKMRYDEAVRADDIPSILVYGGELDRRANRVHALCFGSGGAA